MRPLFVIAPLTIALAAGAAVAATPAPKAAPKAATKAGAAAPAWTVDRAQSRLGFRSSFSGAAFDGTFNAWNAQINFDPNNLAASRVAVTIDMTSARTGDNDRDQTLPTADFFETSKFRNATFVSNNFRSLGGNRYAAAGTLTIRGQARPVTLPFTLQIAGNQATMQGSVVVNRSQFGVGRGQFAGADAIPMDVTISTRVVARRS